MKKLIIGMVLATSISSVAMAEEKKVSSVLPKIDMSFVTDTERNTTKETTATEFGIVAGVNGFALSLLPSYSWTDQKVSDIEFAAGYSFRVNDSFAIVPYGEIHVDENFNSGDNIIGVKTAYKF